MKFSAVFTRDELVAFVSGWLPLKLLLGDARKEDRYLLLSEPNTIDLIPQRGLRISCRAQIRWPVLGLTVPVDARELSVMLRPSIGTLEGHPALVFRVEIERADLAAVPARLDGLITDAVNRALADRVRPALPFGRLLTRSVPMPVLLATTDTIDLSVRSGEVTVEADAFTFELAVDAATTRRALKPA